MSMSVNGTIYDSFISINNDEWAEVIIKLLRNSRPVLNSKITEIRFQALFNFYVSKILYIAGKDFKKRVRFQNV